MLHFIYKHSTKDGVNPYVQARGHESKDSPAAHFTVLKENVYLADHARAHIVSWLAAESGGETSPPARTAGRRSCVPRRHAPTQAGRRQPPSLLLAAAVEEGARRADSTSHPARNAPRLALICDARCNHVYVYVTTPWHG
eukprot:COSAG06_NODE_530_length_14570_cov_23.269435_2_plen_140_part_00